MKKKPVYGVIIIAVMAVFVAYISGKNSSMSSLQHRLDQQIVNDILLLQEDISDVNRAKKLSTDIAVTDLGSLRLHAGALYSHIHEDIIDANDLASDYENSFNYLYHLSWYVETKDEDCLLSLDFMRYSFPITSLEINGEMTVKAVLQQLEDILSSDAGADILDDLILSY